MKALSYVKSIQGMYSVVNSRGFLLMTENRTVTLSDVAARANVSAATVSRALRDPAQVSEKLRARIESAIETLGYVPNSAARALASSRTNVIGVLVPSVTNNVFSAVLEGIYAATDASRFDLQLGYTSYSALKEEGLLRLFLRQRPAGLIVTGIDQSEVSRKLLEAASCPVVQIMEIADDPIDMMVGFSHFEAARAATCHLIERGYRRPGFLGARMDPRTQRRLGGFRDAARAAGVYDEARVITTPQRSTVTLGCQLFAELIEQSPDVDSIFCINDDLALGALFEAQRRRIDVPGQLGICGFNDFDMTAVANPAITSIRTFRREMGERAVQVLFDRIASAEMPLQRIVDMGFEIRARESTAGPASAVERNAS